MEGPSTTLTPRFAVQPEHCGHNLRSLDTDGCNDLKDSLLAVCSIVLCRDERRDELRNTLPIRSLERVERMRVCFHRVLQSEDTE